MTNIDDELDMIKSAIQEYAIDYHNSFKPHYPAPDSNDIILRIAAHTDKAVKEAVAKLSNLYGTARCENLHHPKKWQHKASDGCPVEQAIKELQDGEQ